MPWSGTTRHHFLLCLLACPALGGCAAGVSTMDGYQAPLRLAQPPVYGCTVALANLVDVRTNIDSLGGIGQVRLASDRILDWVESGLHAVAIERASAGAPQAPDLSLVAELHIASVRSMASSKMANVVLAVRYSNDPERKSYYRGAVTGANWWGTAGEAEAALDRALTQAVEQLRDELQARCVALR